MLIIIDAKHYEFSFVNYIMSTLSCMIVTVSYRYYAYQLRDETKSRNNFAKQFEDSIVMQPGSAHYVYPRR